MRSGIHKRNAYNSYTLKKKEKPAPQKGRVTFFLAVPPLLDKSTSLLSGVTIVSLKTTGNGRDPAGSYCVKTVQSAAME
ncbi:hypothetical protein BCE02nite_37170 [Brevibacillus centrosporus]|nr:hypothetical protein EDM55_06555 [Brevibacillus centrosporus]GED32576.1 hypothetical protein BCE02nite_37170 [Brevibacillus centrosporus]